MTTQEIRYDTTEGQLELKRRRVRPIPKPDDVSRPYWAAARRHELMIQKCRECGEYQHPPREDCLLCGAYDLDWERISGKGNVYTFIVDMRLMIPTFDEPYVVAAINPVEAKRDNVRIITNIRDCDPDDVYIGMPVEVLFEDVTDTITLPQFRPTAEAKLRSRGEEPPRWAP